MANGKVLKCQQCNWDLQGIYERYDDHQIAKVVVHTYIKHTGSYEGCHRTQRGGLR
jgi:hypothetical protein